MYLGIVSGQDIAALVIITSSDSATVNEGDTLSKSLTANLPVTWEIVGGDDAGEFDITDSTLTWVGNGTKDFEAPDDTGGDNTYQVIVAAVGLESVAEQTITVTVADVAAPTITSTNTATVAENATLSKSLTANQSVIWSVVGGADQSAFEISGSTLRWLSNGTKDFESPSDANTDNDYIVTVRATSATTGDHADQTITVTVTDVSVTITSSNSATVNENATLSKSLTANTTVTWSIVSGADQAKFEISGSTLRWASNGTKDYESPDDANTDNAYVVTVRATESGGEYAEQTITVTVADVDEVAPTITSSDTISVNENATLSHSLTADETVSWSIVGGADQAQFEISGSTLRWSSNGTRNYEAPADADTDNDYVVDVRATDLASNTTDQTITVTVDDVAENWTPSALGSSTLLVWLKGDTVSGSDGDQISTWSDSSGNARNFTLPVGQATAPELEAGDLNSLNTLHFPNTSNQRYQGPSLSGLGSSVALYLIWKNAADPGGSGTGGPTAFGTDNVNANHTPFSDGVIYNADLSTARKTVGNPSTTLAQYNIIGITSAASSFIYYLNGVSFFSTGTNTVGLSTTPIIGRGKTSANGSNGWVAEIVLVNDITQTTREKTEGYLAHKWGLTARLDAGHPYKSSPPTI